METDYYSYEYKKYNTDNDIDIAIMDLGSAIIHELQKNISKILKISMK